MIKTLFKNIWRFLDILLYLMGFGFIAEALFLWNTIAGLIGTGIICLITGLVIDLLPRKGGGD